MCGHMGTPFLPPPPPTPQPTRFLVPAWPFAANAPRALAGGLAAPLDVPTIRAIALEAALPLGPAAVLAFPLGLPGLRAAIPRHGAPTRETGARPNRLDEVVLPTSSAHARHVRHTADAHGNGPLATSHLVPKTAPAPAQHGLGC